MMKLLIQQCIQKDLEFHQKNKNIPYEFNSYGIFLCNYYTSKFITTDFPATTSPLSTGVIDFAASTLVIKTGVAKDKPLLNIKSLSTFINGVPALTLVPCSTNCSKPSPSSYTVSSPI